MTPSVAKILSLKAIRARLTERIASGDRTVGVEHLQAATEMIKEAEKGKA
jgi:hypothetical protein